VTRVQEIHGTGFIDIYQGDTIYRWLKTDEVARVPPPPVEVREFWRVTVHAGESGDQVYDDLAWHCDTREECIETAAKACKNVRQESATIEHVRETVLSREEVQP
jgi:hypothetical protein